MLGYQAVGVVPELLANPKALVLLQLQLAQPLDGLRSQVVDLEVKIPYLPHNFLVAVFLPAAVSSTDATIPKELQLKHQRHHQNLGLHYNRLYVLGKLKQIRLSTLVHGWPSLSGWQ